MRSRFALTFILWQTLENSSGLIIGTSVGLVLGLAAVWLFMRITPEEAPKTLGYSGTAFVVAILISAGLLTGANRNRAGGGQGFEDADHPRREPDRAGIAVAGARPGGHPAEAKDAAQLDPGDAEGRRGEFRRPGGHGQHGHNRPQGNRSLRHRDPVADRHDYHRPRGRGRAGNLSCPTSN